MFLVATVNAAQRPALIVLGGPGEAARPGLIEALRIQLAGRAEVRAGQSLESGELPSRTEAATAILSSERARLVVWTERAEGGAEGALLLHVVGDREGRVLVLVHPLDAEEGTAAVDRALALKVAEVFDALFASPPALVLPRQLDRNHASRGAGTDTKRDEAQRPDSAAVRVGLVGDIGGWGATGSGTASPQGGVVLGIGARLRYQSLRTEAVAQGRIATALAEQEQHGSVNAAEGAVGGALRLAAALDIVALGGEIGLGGRIIAASGETPEGKTGSETTVVPYAVIMPQATFSIASFLELRAAVGIELALRRHRFTVNDLPVLDLGTVRGTAVGSFVFAMP